MCSRLHLEALDATLPFAYIQIVVALARTLPEMPNSVRFAFPGPLVDRLYVGEPNRDGT